MKCQSLFSGKNKKNILKCNLKFLPCILIVKIFMILVTLTLFQALVSPVNLLGHIVTF